MHVNVSHESLYFWFRVFRDWKYAGLFLSVKSCLSNVHSCFLQHLTSNGQNWVLQLRRFHHVQRWLVMPLTLHRHHLLPLWLPVAWELCCQLTAAVDLLHCPLSGKSLVYIISLGPTIAVFISCFWSPCVIGQTIIFSCCLWSPYVIGQTIIFSSCLFFLSSSSSFFFFLA